jgi:hypothetical protein
VAFGLSSILHERITVKAGAVEQSNFDDYQLLRVEEMPQVEVHFVPSAESPTGFVEPVVPSGRTGGIERHLSCDRETGADIAPSPWVTSS